MDELVMRVAKLERSSRRWRMLAVIAVLLLTVPVLMGVAGQFFDFVLTGQFFLTDAQGRPRIGLITTQAGSAGIVFLDTNQQIRAIFSMDPTGSPGVLFTDSRGKIRADWFTLNDGTTLFNGRDSSELIRTVQFTDKDGNGTFAVRDSKGKFVASLP